MDKKSIKSTIKSEGDKFSNFLKDRLEDNVLEFIEMLENQTSLYLFSGIIRDYFINIKDNNNYDIEIRDVDLVYDGALQMESVLYGYDYIKNSFGGFKIKIGNTEIDIWNLHDTWGLRKQNLSNNKNSIFNLPNSTFFNYSSIVYSLHDKEFIVGDPFIQFYDKREIDIVYEENPYPELCIVNSIYYYNKTNLKLSDKLISYILHHKNIDRKKLINIQIKHFKEEVIKKEEFDIFFNGIKL